MSIYAVYIRDTDESIIFNDGRNRAIVQDRNGTLDTCVVDEQSTFHWMEISKNGGRIKQIDMKPEVFDAYSELIETGNYLSGDIANLGSYIKEVKPQDGSLF